MPQELRGLFTVLCPRCRYREPVFVSGGFRWNCPHRHATVLEMNDRLIVALCFPFFKAKGTGTIWKLYGNETARFFASARFQNEAK